MSKVKTSKNTAGKITIACFSAVLVAGGVIAADELLSKEDREDSNPIEIITNAKELSFTSLNEKQPVLSRSMFADTKNATYSSSNENVCIVDDRGTVLAKGDGQANLSIKMEDGSGHVAERIVPVTVQRSAQLLTLKYTWLSVTTGSTIDLGATSESGLEVSYKSTDENVVQVDENGILKAISPGQATVTVTQAGDDKWQPVSASADIFVAEGTKDRHSALQPFFDSMVEQKEWMKDADYGGWDGTLEGSKRFGDCITLPSASLLRIGLLPEHSSVHPSKKCAEKYSECFEYYPGGKSTVDLIESGELLEGDIVRFDGHTMVYMGHDEEGRILWNSGGHLRMDQPAYGVRILVRMGEFANKTITSILRVKTYTISALCEGGAIGGGGQVMAKQNSTVTFSAEPGKKLASVIVDGQNISIGPDLSSYTFEDVISDHTIEVRFTQAD